MSGVVPLVTLHQAMPRGGRRTNLAPLDFWLGPGLHAVVGTPADGLLVIAKLVSGIEPSASGQVIVAGRDPGRDPDLRARVGAMLDYPRLPSGRRVRDALASVDRLRGGGEATQALQAFGLSTWADRTMARLSRPEQRALELVIAVSTKDAVAVVLSEPGAEVAAYDRQALRSALRRAAAAGACVVVATASMGDAVELADTLHMLERGKIVRWVPVSEAGVLVPGRGLELRVDVDMPRLLVAALADDPAVTGIDWDQREYRSVLSVRGHDLEQLALSIARAASSTGANVRSIAPIAPGLDEVRAAASGLALAAYHAAYGAYLEQDARSRAEAGS